jgi:hypothetical protein
MAAAKAQVQSEIQSPKPEVPKRLFTLREAAAYIGRTPKAIEHLIARGTIQVTKLDGKRQIDRSVLDKLIVDSTHYEC